MQATSPPSLVAGFGYEHPEWLTDNAVIKRVRGNRLMHKVFQEARYIAEKGNSGIPAFSDEAATSSVEADLAPLRSQLHSAHCAPAAAEVSLEKEELEHTKNDVKRLPPGKSVSNGRREVEAQCIDSQKKVFKVTVATNYRLKRQSEDIREQDYPLSSVNKTLRAHVKLEEMDLDVLVLPSKVRLSIGELNWELLKVSGQTCTILRCLLDTADASDSAEDATTGLARVAYREGDVPDLPPEDREHLDEPHPVGRTLKSRGAQYLSLHFP
ncbi:hypothetical protein GN244_ATG06118 [Phytophthora infestans]|uniref:Uncharacterized protein n=1 Tax=Phytophthora infestans TaxID=4787 RepID=A0A833TDN3_PHYIN|nr:hypothetical protein GN244_ATG06118 [Phytophthora infestans]